MLYEYDTKANEIEDYNFKETWPPVYTTYMYTGEVLKHLPTIKWSSVSDLIGGIIIPSIAIRQRAISLCIYHKQCNYEGLVCLINFIFFTLLTVYESYGVKYWLLSMCMRRSNGVIFRNV